MPSLPKLATYICTLQELQCEVYKRQRPQDGYNLNIHQQRTLELKLLYKLQSGISPCYFFQVIKMQSRFLKYSFTYRRTETN